MQEILIATISVSVSEGHTSCPDPVALKNVEQKYLHYEASCVGSLYLINHKQVRKTFYQKHHCMYRAKEHMVAAGSPPYSSLLPVDFPHSEN